MCAPLGDLFTPFTVAMYNISTVSHMKRKRSDTSIQ